MEMVEQEVVEQEETTLQRPLVVHLVLMAVFVVQGECVVVLKLVLADKVDVEETEEMEEMVSLELLD